MADLSVNIKDLKLKNPVMTASGTFGYGLEFADFVPLEEIGGIIVKGTTLEPREGNDYPRMAETPQGMLNCVGLQNKGVEYFCEHIYPQIKDIDTNMIVNVSGHSPESYAECAARVNELDKIPAIELNISCPNVKDGGMAFGVTCEGAASVVKAVRKVYDKTLIVKLSPNVTSIADIARAVEAEGCRLCFTHQYIDGYGGGYREAPAAAEHPYRRFERPLRQAGGIAHGLRCGPRREDSGSRTGRYSECQGCHRVYDVWCYCHRNRYCQLHRSSRNQEGEGWYERVA